MSKKLVKKSKPLPKNSRLETNISSIENSFLNETSFNSDVDIDIRNEIEKKFKRSSVNSKYVFPRNVQGESRPKKSPVKARQNLKPKLLMEKSLPVMHKITKSMHDSTGIIANLTSNKKIHRVTSSIRSIKETKIKITRGRNTPVSLSHNRAVSHGEGSRSKSPIYSRKENSLDNSSRHRRAVSNKRGCYENTISRPKSVLKKPGHLYTASMENVVPSSIIKSVSYY